MKLHIRGRLAAAGVAALGVLLSVLIVLGKLPTTFGMIFITTGVYSAALAMNSWSQHDPEAPHPQDELRKGLMGTIFWGVLSAIFLIWGPIMASMGK